MTMEAMSESQSLLTLVTVILSIRARCDKVTQEVASSGRQAGEERVHHEKLID